MFWINFGNLNCVMTAKRLMVASVEKAAIYYNIIKPENKIALKKKIFFTLVLAGTLCN